MPKKKAINQNKSLRKRRRVKKWLRGAVFYYESKNFGLVYGMVIVSEQKRCCSESEADGSLSTSLNMVTKPPRCIIFVQNEKSNRLPVLAITEGAPLETAYQVPKSMRNSLGYKIFEDHIRAAKLLMKTFDLR